MDYRDMTIWELEQERAKIEAELVTRTRSHWFPAADIPPSPTSPAQEAPRS